MNYTDTPLDPKILTRISDADAEKWLVAMLASSPLIENITITAWRRNGGKFDVHYNVQSKLHCAFGGTFPDALAELMELEVEGVDALRRDAEYHRNKLAEIEARIAREQSK